MNSYLICYDIKFKYVKDKKSAKRLRKIAKYLEGVSIRIQKSIFFIPQINKKELDEIINKLKKIIDPTIDDARIYKINNFGISLGDAMNLDKNLSIV